MIPPKKADLSLRPRRGMFSASEVSFMPLLSVLHSFGFAVPLEPTTSPLSYSICYC